MSHSAKSCSLFTRRKKPKPKKNTKNVQHSCAKKMDKKCQIFGIQSKKKNQTHGAEGCGPHDGCRRSSSSWIPFRAALVWVLTPSMRRWESTHPIAGDGGKDDCQPNPVGKGSAAAVGLWCTGLCVTGFRKKKTWTRNYFLAQANRQFSKITKNTKITPRVFDVWMHANSNKKTLETYSPESGTRHGKTIATQTPRIAAMI